MDKNIQLEFCITCVYKKFDAANNGYTCGRKKGPEIENDKCLVYNLDHAAKIRKDNIAEEKTILFENDKWFGLYSIIQLTKENPFSSILIFSGLILFMLSDSEIINPYLSIPSSILIMVGIGLLVINRHK